MKVEAEIIEIDLNPHNYSHILPTFRYSPHSELCFNHSNLYFTTHFFIRITYFTPSPLKTCSFAFIFGPTRKLARLICLLMRAWTGFHAGLPAREPSVPSRARLRALLSPAPRRAPCAAVLLRDNLRYRPLAVCPVVIPYYRLAIAASQRKRC